MSKFSPITLKDPNSGTKKGLFLVWVTFLPYPYHWNIMAKNNFTVEKRKKRLKYYTPSRKRA